MKEVVDRRAAEAATKVATAQLAETISRARAKEEALIRKLEHYENHELDAIESEPNRAKRISRRRDWISSVLSEATGTQD